MKTYQTNQLRNIALLGNASSGKTTLVEAILLESGAIDRKGTVEQKNTVSDHMEIEHENGSSVFSSVITAEYNDRKLNFVDAPGNDDFIGGAVSALHVCDTTLMLLNAQNGVEVGTEIQNRYADAAGKPMVIAVNQLDHDKSNFEKTVEMARERIGNNVTIVQYPVSEGPDFTEVVDVLVMKLFKYSKEGGKAEILDIPGDQKARAEDLHNELVEKAAENDEALMEKFFEEGTLNEDDMRSGIKTGLLQRGIFPVFCISAKNSIGIGRMLEFLTNVAPAPDEVAAPKTQDNKEIKCDASAPASLFVFKSSVEPHIGEVNYFKVMSGTIKESDDLTNNNSGTKERLSQLLVPVGKKREKVPTLYAGDLASTVKLKSTKINHTLTVSNQGFKFPPIQFPEPKYRTAIRPVSEGDEEKLGESLSRMHQEDPTILIEYSKELKQIIVSGQGEYHLNILKWHLDNIFKIETEFIPPKIPYRETITKVSQADYRHKKQSGGAGQFGEVHLVIEPFVEGIPDPTMYKVGGKEIKISVRDKEEINLSWGGKLIYYNCIVGGSIDARFMPAILKGIMEKMEEGPLTGSYARDIRVAVYDGKMHPVDSNEISFKLAGRNAFSMAFKSAGPKIMEPIYQVEVWVPSDRMGDVMSDLQGRRGIVQGMTSEKGFEKINAKVPLSEMNKYSTALSSITGGRAMYNMKFSEYAQVPPDIQDKLLKEYEEQQKED